MTLYDRLWDFIEARHGRQADFVGFVAHNYPEFLPIVHGQYDAAAAFEGDPRVVASLAK